MSVSTNQVIDDLIFGISGLTVVRGKDLIYDCHYQERLLYPLGLLRSSHNDGAMISEDSKFVILYESTGLPTILCILSKLCVSTDTSPASHSFIACQLRVFLHLG